jgi:hypothetical protein
MNKIKEGSKGIAHIRPPSGRANARGAGATLLDATAWHLGT